MPRRALEPCDRATPFFTRAGHERGKTFHYPILCAEKIEKEAEDREDAFLLACFPDAFGIPSPVSYYTAELLPYLEDEFEAWERRMWNRGSLLERKGEQYHF